MLGRDLSNPDLQTNRPTSSYLDELVKELQSITNMYDSSHSAHFRNAQKLLIREIQRILNVELLVNSLGTGSPSVMKRARAGRDTDRDHHVLELSPIGNYFNGDALPMTPLSSIGSSSSQRRHSSFSPLPLSMDGSVRLSTFERDVKENNEKQNVTKEEKLFFPPESKSNTNPIGRLIGPRGITIRQLEKDLNCKLHIRGKGCTNNSAKEEILRGRSGWEHLEEPIHVLIIVSEDEEEKATEKMSFVKRYLQDFLENSDSDLKRAQLMQLAVIEGTLK